MSQHKQLQHVRRWLEHIVIELNLCPFAKRELLGGRIRFELSAAKDEESLLADLKHELEYLQAHPEIETSLLAHPNVLQNFSDYNQFLDLADALLDALNLIGVMQIASFHPHYQFAGTDYDDVENFTNRSPYPLLHILREDSLSRAVDNHPDSTAIPEHNIALMKMIGFSKMQSKLDSIVK